MLEEGKMAIGKAAGAPFLGMVLLAALGGCIAPGQARLFDGAVTLAAPQGYCVAPGSAREGRDGAIVLMGRCADATDRAAAVLTATAGQSESAAGFSPATDAEAIAGFFQSEPGRRMLSRRGRTADVDLLETQATSQAFLLYLRDGGAGPAVQPESWRAILPLDGRLVTLTVAGPADAPLPRDAGLAILRHFIAATLAANRG